MCCKSDREGLRGHRGERDRAQIDQWYIIGLHLKILQEQHPFLKCSLKTSQAPIEISYSASSTEICVVPPFW